MVLGFVVVASAGVAVVSHHRHERAREADDRGRLTTSEYTQAVAIAKMEIAQDHATLSRAVAYLTGGKSQDSDASTPCASNYYLVVSLVGDFPTIRVSPAPGAPSGPDMWVTVKADPISGQVCLAGVSTGHFETRAGSANLSPAL
jgi:hypothetical protein